MLDHIGIKVSNLARSKEFYRAALRPLSYALSKEIPEAAGFGVANGPGKSPDPAGDFWLIQADPPLPRIHVAFNASAREQVDAFFAAACAAGRSVPAIPSSFTPATGRPTACRSCGSASRLKSSATPSCSS